MQRKMGRVIACLLIIASCFGGITGYAAESFVANPETTYAAQFIEKCEGQQWFLDEIERLLNMEQKTINGLESSADFKNIKSIGLADKGVSGRIPAAIGELTQLRYLFLSDNELGGTIPDELFSLPYLENIDLSDNLYDIAIPKEFGTMASLRILMLRENGFIGTIPSEILSNTDIKVLDVSSNELSGALPTGLNQMTGLEYLAVSDNNWGGTLPDLSALSALKTLSAWNCKLTGQIPDSVYSLLNLQVLDLAGNSFEGEISSAIGNLTALQLLSLGSNGLTGSIPSEIGNLTQLQTLDISDNELRGLVPDMFANMEALTEIHIEDNKLRGLIPDSLKAKYDSGTLVYAQNNYMTGSNLLAMENNQKNFTDSATTEQYQLTVKQSPVQIKTDAEVNVYAYLQNKSYTTGNVTNKLRLPAEDYVVTITNGDASKITISIREDGIYVLANEEVLKNEKFQITISIKDNTDSLYSQTILQLTTEKLTTSSGGGGVSANTTSDSKEVKTEYHSPYINGYQDGTFRATSNVTREEVAKMIITVLGEEVNDTVLYTSYTDVTKNRWSAPYIERAKKLSYLIGDTGGTFRPEDNMTRAELAACLVRVAETLGAQGEEEVVFSDVSANKWYVDYVTKAGELGLVTGYSDGTFRPENKVTRAETVTMINRMMGRDPETASELKTITSPFTDTPESAWYYMDMLEASVGHNHEV